MAEAEESNLNMRQNCPESSELSRKVVEPAPLISDQHKAAELDRKAERAEKLKQLHERRLLLCEKTTQQRIERLQKQAVRAAKKAGVFEQDMKAHESTENKSQKASGSRQENTLEPVGEEYDPIKELRPFMMINQRLEHGPGSRELSKNPVLEKKLEDAIASKKFSLAERISTQMVQEERSKVLRDAVHAKEYYEEKLTEDEKKREKKRKLHWTFDSKQRWETKGNM